jgi:phenylpropionate dioxygenase-like ring-hydroxylating dioxygenase large terminal subunit
MLQWPENGITKVPYQVFLDRDIYAREQERIYRGPIWSFVALEAEIPKAGDYKATFIGDTPVVVTRDQGGELRAFVNRCAHRGALVCSEPHGNSTTLVCPYHQWCYDGAGNLVGIPFRRGIEGKGGYPKDFDLKKYSLTKLRVDSYDGLVFATFSDTVEPLLDYLGPAMTPFLDRHLSRPIKVLGYSRQYVNANWKLYFENVKDPYHASLLHLFHTTFGLYRATQGGGIIMDAKHRHDMLRALKKTEEEELAGYKDAGLRTYDSQYKLADPSLLAGVKEYDGLHIHSIFPCLVVQQISNSLAVRQLLPKAPDRFELIFTYFGYEDDSEEMLAARVKQANLVGPAGFVSMEDGYASEIVQQAIIRDGDACSVLEAGGSAIEDQETLVTETAIRGFWQNYRELMGFDA